MFKNIGGKIKAVAKVFCIIGIVVSVISGVGMMAAEAGTATVIGGIVLILVGSLLSWIGSFFTYGFGELVEKTSAIAEMMAKADARKNNAE